MVEMAGSVFGVHFCRGRAYSLALVGWRLPPGRFHNLGDRVSKHLFTSESVTEGHPDKMADAISDSVLDACLAEDPMSRVACETMVTTGLCVIAGEISTNARPNIARVAREAIKRIGYTDAAYGIDGDTCAVMVSLDEQSPDIAMGVDKAAEQRAGTGDPYDEVGAGDQGMMFGYACDETEDLMPMPIWLAHKMAAKLAEVRRSGAVNFLRPDAKTQVTFEYENGVPVRLDTVLISTQHHPNVSIEADIRPALIEHVIMPCLPEAFRDDKFEIFVNPTGAFVLGGPHADCGLTGRKIIVDTYGGMARHGGGAFSGKDPTKVDRSAAYAVRQIAKTVVAAGIAKRCEAQVAYAIGVARPMSIYVDTFGTSQIAPEKVEQLVKETFDMRPAALINRLDLRRPIFHRTSAYGHFGRKDTAAESAIPGFTWENTEPYATQMRKSAEALA